MNSQSVKHISECFIIPHHVSEESQQPLYLAPTDLVMLSVHYIQKCLLVYFGQAQALSFPLSCSLWHQFHRCHPRDRSRYWVEEYYKKQERLLEGFNEMETMTEEGWLSTSLNRAESATMSDGDKTRTMTPSRTDSFPIRWTHSVSSSGSVFFLLGILSPASPAPSFRLLQDRLQIYPHHHGSLQRRRRQQHLPCFAPPLTQLHLLLATLFTLPTTTAQGPNLPPNPPLGRLYRTIFLLRFPFQDYLVRKIVNVRLVHLGATKLMSKLLETVSSTKEGRGKICEDGKYVSRIVQRLLKVSSAREGGEHAGGGQIGESFERKEESWGNTWGTTQEKKKKKKKKKKGRNE
ncbi:hypothetical protein ACFXTH_007766 [Malus domestica]